MEAGKPTGNAGRLAGGLLVGALVIMATGAMIGFVAPSLRDAPWEGDLSAIAGNPTAHFWANGLILAAGVLTTLGLVVLSLRFQEPGRAWAWMGMVAFAFAAVFLALDRILAMEVETWAASQDAETAVVVFEAFERFEEGLSRWFYLLGFGSLSFYGIALTRTETARESGLVFVVVGGLGILLAIAGAAIPGLVFLGTAALGAATWRLGQVPVSNS